MEFDIIGDVHGHAEPLERLLDSLGYVETDGAYRHPEGRTVIFLGDIIDRGPDQLRSIEIVRSMQATGTARCLMGNHEHAAIGWLTEDPDEPGEYLRPHTDKNHRQHRVFLEQLGEDPEFRREILDWMLGLPVYLDLPGLRCVHACWQPDVIRDLEALTEGSGLLRGQVLRDSFEKGHPTRELVDITIRGRETDLEPGSTFIDSDGVERDKSRVRWWSDFVPEKLRDLIVDDIETEADADPTPFFFSVQDTDTRPVFFGHYWMKGEPRLVSLKSACLDFSIADNGSLCAYSWAGERTLDPARLSHVDYRVEFDQGMKFG